MAPVSVSADTSIVCRGTHSAHRGRLVPQRRPHDALRCACAVQPSTSPFVVVAATQTIGARSARADTTESFSIAQTELKVGAPTSVTLTVTTSDGDPAALAGRRQRGPRRELDAHGGEFDGSADQLRHRGRDCHL
jgi:hypothetical protein